MTSNHAEREVDGLSKRVNSTISSEAGLPGAKPATELVARWRRVTRWTPDQGVALALALDPDTAADLAHRPEGDLGLKFLDLAQKAIEAGELPTTAKPGVFIDWARKAGLAFHINWLGATRHTVDQPFDELEPHDAEIVKAWHTRWRLIDDWAKAPTWSMLEGVALSLDIPPVHAREALKRKHTDYGIKLNHRHDFAIRAYRMAQLASDSKPSEFIAWAKTVDFEFSPEWEISIPKEASADVQTPTEELPFNKVDTEVKLSTLERTSLLKLIIGMAVEQYGYNPKVHRNSATANIKTDLESVGLSLDEDTIRKWLKEAADLLDGDALEDE